MLILHIISPALRSTYELYLSELVDHSNFFAETLGRASGFDDSSDTVKYLEKSARKLERRFHLIKGGAGFLKLTKIEKLGTTGESWFRHGKIQVGDTHKLLGDLKNLLDEFDHEISLLRDKLAVS